MNLWIRSQDRKALIPINKMITITLDGIFYDGIILGTYRTEERALEVLDEIMNLLKPIVIKQEIDNSVKNVELVYKPITTYESIETLDVVVYKMPKE